MPVDAHHRVKLLSKYGLAIMHLLRLDNVEEEPVHAAFTETELEVLRYMEEAGECIVSDISTLLRVAPTTATSLIDRLEKKKLLSRKRTEHDRRIVLLSLTREGKDLVMQANREQHTRWEKVFSLLSVKEQEKMISIYKKLFEHYIESTKEGSPQNKRIPERQGVNLISNYNLTFMRYLRWGNVEEEPVHAAFSESELGALRFIDDADECIVSDISNLLRSAPATTTLLIDRLEKKKLISRARTERNRRIVLISLTKEGKDMVRKAAREQDARSKKTLTALSIEEQDTLIKLYEKLASFDSN